MNLVVLLAFATLVGCNANIRRCKVSLPSACADLRTVADCGLWTACEAELLAAVVKPAKVQGPSSCAMCEKVIEVANSTIGSPYFERVIKLAATISCYYSPEPTACGAVIDELTDLIMRMLKANMDAEKICTTLKLCNDLQLVFDNAVAADLPRPVHAWSELEVFPDQSKAVLKQDVACEICEAAVVELQQVLPNPEVQQEILNVLQSACSVMPSEVQAECDSLVKNYMEMVVSFITSHDAASVCQMVSLCNQQAVSLHAEETVNNETCAVCESAVTEAQSFLKDESHQQEFRQALLSACAMLPDTYHTTCTTYVSEYFTLVVSIFLNTSPSTLCAKIGMCSALGGSPLVAAESGDAIFSHIESHNSCDHCIHDMKAVIRAVKGKKEDEIIAYMEAQCNRVPAEMKANCTAFVKEHGKEIAEMILAGKNAFEICQALGPCKRPTAAKAFFGPEKYLDLHPSSSSEVTFIDTTAPLENKDEDRKACEMCARIMDRLIHDVKGKSEQQIVAYLEGLCQKAPEQERAKCKAYMEAHAKEIAEMILAGKCAHEICEKLGACRRSENEAAGQEEGTVEFWGQGDHRACEMCTRGMDRVINETKGKSEKDIISVLIHTCDRAPTYDRQRCRAFMESHGKEIAEMIREGKCGHEICAKIRVCVEFGYKSQLVRPGVRPQEFLGSSDAARFFAKETTECALCMRIFAVVVEMTAGKAEEQIVEFLESLCSRFPVEKQDKCNVFMQAFAKKIADWIMQGYTPAQICEELGACSTLDVPSAMVDNYRGFGRRPVGFGLL